MTIAIDSTLTGVPITRNLIAALRVADDVSFHHYRGEGWIRASLRDNRPDLRIFTAREQRMFPLTDKGTAERGAQWPVTTSIWGYGSKDGGSDIGYSYDWPAWRGQDKPSASAFYMIHTPSMDKPWQTIVSLLRPDDVLHLEWTADNNTDLIRAAGLHQDELVLHVHRASGTLSFDLQTAVGRDNTARMIRR